MTDLLTELESAPRDRQGKMLKAAHAHLFPGVKDKAFNRFLFWRDYLNAALMLKPEGATWDIVHGKTVMALDGRKVEARNGGCFPLSFAAACVRVRS